jgi:hypothetical protein
MERATLVRACEVTEQLVAAGATDRLVAHLGRTP